MFRSADHDAGRFLLVAQFSHEVPRGGVHAVDLSTSPIEVKVGDVVGFYAPGESLVPYDVVGDGDGDGDGGGGGGGQPFFLLPRKLPAVGETMVMEMLENAGRRDYSLNVTVVPGEPPRRQVVPRQSSPSSK